MDLLGRLSRSQPQIMPSERVAAPGTVSARPDGPTRRTHPRLTAAEVDQLIEARQAGASIEDLADAFSAHRSTVMSHLRMNGIAARNAWSAGQLEQAVAMYEAGSSLADVAHALGCGTSTAGRRLRAAGLTLRPRGFQ